MIVAVANRKGGVGKTTVTLYLAAALARRGRRVLVVDLDENATELLRVGVGVMTPTIVQVLEGEMRMDQAVVATPWAGVDLVPSDAALQRWSGGPDTALRERLHGWRAHDVVLIDCPPTLGPLTRNAMGAADRVLAVMEASFSALRGLEGFLDAFDAARAAVNPDLRFAGVVLNLLDRNREQRGRLEELHDAIEAGAVWEPFIPRRAVIAEALGAGRTLYDPLAGRGAAEMAALFDVLATRLVTPDPPPAAEHDGATPTAAPADGEGPADGAQEAVGAGAGPDDGGHQVSAVAATGKVAAEGDPEVIGVAAGGRVAAEGDAEVVGVAAAGEGARGAG